MKDSGSPFCEGTPVGMRMQDRCWAGAKPRDERVAGWPASPRPRSPRLRSAAGCDLAAPEPPDLRSNLGPSSRSFRGSRPGRHPPGRCQLRNPAFEHAPRSPQMISAKAPTETRAPSDRVIIFDTTLRDGEQSPGASMNLEEKLKIAAALEDLGVDVIEAGFPISSNGDFEAVRAIAAQTRQSIVCGLSRAAQKDIDRAWEALQQAKRPRIHTFISTSPLHMKYKLQMEPEQVYQAVIDSVTLARKLCEDVEWSC